MIAVGVYGVDSFQSLRFAAARLLVAICLGVIFLSVVYFTLPGRTMWRSNSLYAMGISYAALVIVRILLGKMLGSESFKRRVLVLGAGQRAMRLAKLGAAKGAAFTVVGHVDMGDVPSVIPTAIPRSLIENFSEYVTRLGANEVVLALEERRKAIPMADLLRVRTAGVHVNEISTFLERETGRVDLAALVFGGQARVRYRCQRRAAAADDPADPADGAGDQNRIARPGILPPEPCRPVRPGI
jgi:FlaA1/EpsC-like NDP-sugar epimerase